MIRRLTRWINASVFLFLVLIGVNLVNSGSFISLINVAVAKEATQINETTQSNSSQPTANASKSIENSESKSSVHDLDNPNQTNQESIEEAESLSTTVVNQTSHTNTENPASGSENPTSIEGLTKTIMGNKMGKMGGNSGIDTDAETVQQVNRVIPEVLPDTFGRDTPRGTVQGFMRALSNEDNLLASNYLQLSQDDNPNTIVRKFKKALDSGGKLIADLQLSSSHQGTLNDDLPPNIDKVGVIDVDGQQFPLQLIHIQKEDGRLIWMFSAETLAQVPEIVANSEPTLAEQYNVDALDKTKVFGMNISDIVLVAIVTFTTFSAMYVALWLLYLGASIFFPRVRNKPLPVKENIILPLALVLGSVILQEMMVGAGVSVTTRESVSRYVDILAWGAMTWLLFRVIDTTSSQIEQFSHKYKRIEQLAIIGLIRKLVKLTVFIFAAIVIFGNLGFDLTTGIATLGIGGLALALGAQKTVENLVGSVVVVVDQPVRVGDYCRFGDQEGIVIEIGIRSTRVRTFERSIVTIPNGDFASMQIENYTAKDMFRFYHKLFIKRTADVDIIHKMIKELDEFLHEHYLTNQEWNQVNISELRQDCYIIYCQAYIEANSMPEFLDKQNVVLIDLLKKVATYQVEHALPTQQVLLESGESISK